VPLTRGIAGGVGGAGGLDEGAHEALDTLVHKLAENSYYEFTYTGKNLTRVTVWTSVAMVLKIRESDLTYTGLTKTLGYTGKDLTSIDVTKTIPVAASDPLTLDESADGLTLDEGTDPLTLDEFL
jgi:hypothetical protein